MQHQPWLAVFSREFGPLDQFSLAAWSSERRPMILVDGTQFVSDHIARFPNPNGISRELAAFLRTKAQAMQAKRMHIYFDSERTNILPGAVESDSARKDRERHFQGVDTRDFKQLAGAMIGDRASTQWPTLLNDKRARQLYWRTPLFEWQFYASVNWHFADCFAHTFKLNAIADCVDSVTLSGVPLSVGGVAFDWNKCWLDHENATRNRLLARLDALPPGAYFRDGALNVMTVLDLGYGHLGSATYTRGQRAPTTVPLEGDVHDACTLCAHAIYKDALERTGNSAWYVCSARGGLALWSFLLLTHRLIESHVVYDVNHLRFIVEFASGGGVVDMARLYYCLSQRLGPLGPFAMEAFLLIMRYQCDPMLGARNIEIDAQRTWDLFFSTNAGSCQLVSVHTPHRGSLAATLPRELRIDDANARLALQDPPTLLRWCETLVDVYRLQEFGRAAAAASVLQPLGFDGRASPLFVQTAYRQFKDKLGAAGPPSLPSECMARARRAHWCLDYARRAYYLASATLARSKRFDGAGSFWGWKRSELELADAREWFLRPNLRIELGASGLEPLIVTNSAQVIHLQ